MTRLRYETLAGNLSESATFEQIKEHLRLAAEGCFVAGHYRKANEDTLSGDKFMAIGNNLMECADLVNALATKSTTIVQ